MSVRVLTKVLTHSQATLAARLVLLVLADAAHDDGITWIDQDTIAAKALVDARTVRRCVRELEAAGELEMRKAQRGRRRINVCRVVMPGLLEPDYDRLPFALAAPFTTGHPARPSANDDRSSDVATTGHPVRDSGGAHLKDLEPSVNHGEANASPPWRAPKVSLVEGQSLGWNALREACGIHPDDKNADAELAVALNGGGKGRGVAVGIRDLVWGELIRSRFAGDEAAARHAVAEDPSRFEQAVAAMIERRAGQYAATMSGALLTPIALAKWWLRLEALAADRVGMTAEQMEAS